jgi:hypothetical protein
MLIKIVSIEKIVVLMKNIYKSYYGICEVNRDIHKIRKTGQ